MRWWDAGRVTCLTRVPIVVALTYFLSAKIGSVTVTGGQRALRVSALPTLHGW